MTRHATNRIIAGFRIENELYNNEQEMRRRETK
jgi:hypothetical protein